MLISFLSSLFADSDTLESPPIPPGHPGFLARCMLVSFLVLVGGLIAGKLYLFVLTLALVRVYIYPLN
jgi:hypothetical protein